MKKIEELEQENKLLKLIIKELKKIPIIAPQNLYGKDSNDRAIEELKKVRVKIMTENCDISSYISERIKKLSEE